MDEMFYWLFNMSIAASLAGAVVVILRLIKKIPRRIIVILWIIPLLRFLFPLGVNSRYGLMELLSKYMTRTVVVYDGVFADFSMMNSAMVAESYFPVTYKTDLFSDVFRYASIVWAIIACALIITMFILYTSTVSELKSAEHLYGIVYRSERIASPAVYGIFRPKIVIPTSYKESANLDFIILHERRHIRRLDNLWRIVAFLTAAIHWFNPLTWIFLKLYLSDVELACDESVLSNLSDDERGRYAHALLDACESKGIFASSFGGAKIRTRIEHIISFKKMTVLSAAGFGVFTAVIAYILLTNAA